MRGRATSGTCSCGEAPLDDSLAGLSRPISFDELWGHGVKNSIRGYSGRACTDGRKRVGCADQWSPNGQPLCYVGLGAKKSYNALYLMGAYDSSNGEYTTPFAQKLLVDAFKKAGKRHGEMLSPLQGAR